MFRRLPYKPIQSFKETWNGWYGRGGCVFLPPCPREIIRISQHRTTSRDPLLYRKCHAHKTTYLGNRSLDRSRANATIFLLNPIPEWILHFVTWKFIFIQVKCVEHDTAHTHRYFPVLKIYFVVQFNTNLLQYLLLLILGRHKVSYMIGLYIQSVRRREHSMLPLERPVC
jgi:hypothetical protein